MLSALRYLAKCAICRFSRLFSSPWPFKYHTIFTELESYCCYHKKNYSNTVPYHAIAATIPYVNRELINTPRLPYSAVETLRAAGETRNALLLRRIRSAISRSTLRVGQDIAPGIKGKYNHVCTSRVYLSSDTSDDNTVRPHDAESPLPQIKLIIAAPSDLDFSRPAPAFAPAFKRRLFFLVRNKRRRPSTHALCTVINPPTSIAPL